MNYPAWQLKKGDPAAEKALAGAGCGVLLRRVLAARGCTDPAAAQALLGQGEPLSDPFLLTDMDKAVVRIQEAIENEELMVIYGDYDVDGISATAILYECLTSQGAHVRCKLPTRGSGYGLTRAALESLASKGFKLVVTVDNGISAVEEAACAKELGLDLIITDHHLPGDTLPDAIAVVDPKRPDDESPFKDLCGAGVAFKLCAALEGCDPAELLEMYGELAALGTVADVMPLVGENRTIVREGLSLLQDTMRPGLHALLESAGCGGKPVTADTVSYSLAPRLNAAGRMDNAAVALKLLLCGDEDQATGIAERLAEINTERQQTEQQVFAAALQALEADPARTRDRVLVVSGEDWHPGVIGIVAARLMERFSRPVIVISMHEGEGRGSGRAPDPFDLHSALADCAQYLTRFGGHAAAAGVEIEEENLAAFRQTINAWAAAHAAPPEAVSLRLDAAATLGELNLENVGELARLAPLAARTPRPCCWCSMPLWTASGRWARRAATPASGCGRAATRCLRRASALRRRRLPIPSAVRWRPRSRSRSSTGAAGRWCPHTSRLSALRSWAILPVNRPRGLRRSAPAAASTRPAPPRCCRPAPTRYRSTGVSAAGMWQPRICSRFLRRRGRRTPARRWQA